VFHKSKLTAIVAIAVACGASPAFAQARAWEGDVSPMVFGSQGERHYHVNGHDGPFDPPMSPPDSAAPVSRRVSRDRATK
jgi:hypothetical protein